MLVVFRKKSCGMAHKLKKRWIYTQMLMVTKWTRASTSKLVENREAYIERIRGSYKNGLDNNKVEWIKGYAEFVDEKTLRVNGELVTADHILIATGGEPALPSIPGAEFGITSDGFFALKELPKKVAVVGADTLRLN